MIEDLLANALGRILDRKAFAIVKGVGFAVVIVNEKDKIERVLKNFIDPVHQEFVVDFSFEQICLFVNRDDQVDNIA